MQNPMPYVLAFMAAFMATYWLWTTFAGMREKKLQLESKAVEKSPLLKGLLPVLGRAAFVASRIKVPKYRSRISDKLRMAGHPAEMGVDEFIALKILGLIGFPAALALALWEINLVLTAILGIIGFFLPDMWLDSVVQQRHKMILRALPYTLDLVTVMVEAGLDFMMAIKKVVERGKRGPLRDELAIMLDEMMVGKSRKEALRRLDERVGLPELGSVVRALIQADELGTGLAPALRIQAEHVRTKYFQQIEKLASQAPVKMLIPLVLFIFPCVFAVLLGPIVIGFLTGQFF